MGETRIRYAPEFRERMIELVRLGFMKSLIVAPSLRNSGLETIHDGTFVPSTTILSVLIDFRDLLRQLSEYWVSIQSR